MAIPRARLYNPAESVVAHCISRCVRRSPLLALDHRHRALRERLRELVAIFAIDVLEWVLLTNHFHLVASTHPDLVALWSDREVATRWRTLCPDHAWRRRNKIDRSLTPHPHEIEEALRDPEELARWRRNLGDLSVFHKFLKQKIARIINLEEDITGHCWEGRFKSIVALDEEAVIAHMVYVALNPVRAAMATALEDYEFASVTERIDDLKGLIRAGAFVGEVEAARKKLYATKLLPAMPCDPGPEAVQQPTLRNGLPNPWLDGRVPPVAEGLTLAAFLAETYAVGRIKRVGKRGVIPATVPSPLADLDRELSMARAEPGRAWEEASPFLSRLRATIGGVEEAMARGLESPWGSFSGGAASLAKKARETGRKFLLSITACAPGGARRIAAERAPKFGIAGPQPPSSS